MRQLYDVDFEQSAWPWPLSIGATQRLEWKLCFAKKLFCFRENNDDGENLLYVHTYPKYLSVCKGIGISTT